MSRYKLTASLEIDVSQHGRQPMQVRSSGRQLAQVFTQAVNELLASDADLRERLWRSAGGGDDMTGVMSFTVVSVDPE